MISNTAALFALFGATALASPIPDPQGLTPVPICSVLEYRNLKQGMPYDAEPRMAASGHCTSDTSDCEITKGQAFSVTVEESISSSVGGGLDLGRIFTLGLDIGFTYTWGTTNEDSESTTVKCPAGGLTCNVMGRAKMLNITGEAKATSDPLKGKSCFPPTDKWEPFEIMVPYEETNSDGLGPVVTYQTCLMACNDESHPYFPNSCDLEAAKKLPDCPTRIPSNTQKDTTQGEGAFGGETGHIKAPWV